MLTIQMLIDSGRYEVLNTGEETDRQIRDVFCCDLLSVAMSQGVEDAAGVPVMGNINTLAVLSLTAMACVVLAEGAPMDPVGLEKAGTERITVLRTKAPVFKTALEIYGQL